MSTSLHNKVFCILIILVGIAESLMRNIHWNSLKLMLLQRTCSILYSKLWKCHTIFISNNTMIIVGSYLSK